MPKHIIHKIWKRSWWDGSVTAYCGLRAESGTYRETWFRGQTNCPRCLQAKKNQR